MAKKPLKYMYVSYMVGHSQSHEEVIERSEYNKIVNDTLHYLMEENPKSVVLPRSRVATEEEVECLLQKVQYGMSNK